MSDLIPFSRIDPDDPNGNWTPEQIEASDFLSKMDWEGGLDGLIGYGGFGVFPEELQPLARAYEDAHEALRNALDVWAAARGVEY